MFLIYGLLAFLYIGALLAFIGLWFVGRARDALGVFGAVIALALIFFLARRGIMDWARSVALAVRGWRAARVGRKWWRWPVFGALGVVLVLAVLPWTLTTSGQFVVAPVNMLELTAPDSGLIAAVFVREGMQVETGAPLVRLIDRDVEREMLAAARTVDSLSVATSRARSVQSTGLVERLEAERSAAVARFASVQARVDALTLRARWAGTVTTPRVQELEGRRVDAGDRIMQVATLDTLEARVSLARAGATRVYPGEVVHLIAYGDASNPVDANVAGVAEAGDHNRGTIEIRVPVRRDSGWRAGATGEASVELRRSTALVALWWNVRQKLRNDILL